MRDWIDAQEFPYVTMEPKQVIQFLKQTAEVKGLPFLTRRAGLPIVHARTDGSFVARFFDLSFRPLDRSVRIDLAPADDPRVVALQRKTDEQAKGAANQS